MSIRYLPDSPPVFDTAKARARWAAAKADYLAGGGAPEVCERHGLSLRTFRWRARKEGWRRADQPAPSLAPDPAPPAQDEPLVIPEAPEAPSGTPLTTSQMVDKCWSHVQAAVAAGQLIQARGWLRLYKELKPLVPFTEIEAREAAESAAGEEDVARPLHCFSDPEPRTPEPEPPSPSAPEPDPTHDLVRLTTHLAAAARQAETAALGGDVAPPLHCFSAPESHQPPPADDPPPDAPAADAVPDPLPARDLARLIAALQAVTARAEQTLDAETARLPLHSFSPPESHHPGQGP
ncbi:hypothetical protein [Brevundimonas abyssalis]|uniref:Uncharacterized protein n=2 Tax=Brevundimonas TaxID=41275 RepID=A0A8E0KIQ2_9CAUL|nr:hypothetical protein [Brevundimonas abyssalis]GAD58941.1 hypothetical protein MBEBAB_1191 [Brevundimonas abyssalis TAR-001]